MMGRNLFGREKKKKLQLGDGCWREMCLEAKDGESRRRTETLETDTSFFVVCPLFLVRWIHKGEDAAFVKALGRG